MVPRQTMVWFFQPIRVIKLAYDLKSDVWAFGALIYYMTRSSIPQRDEFEGTVAKETGLSENSKLSPSIKIQG